jgi:hypothetical protein
VPVPVTAFHVDPDPAVLRSYAAAGVTRCVFTLPGGPARTLQKSITRLNELIARAGNFD